MKFFVNRIVAKFKPRRENLEEIAPWLKEPQSYVFNQATSIPLAIQQQMQKELAQLSGKPLIFHPHANNRSGQKQINLQDIPGLNGVFPHPNSGFYPVEVEHDGKNLTKLLMRGPLNETHNVVMPIALENNKPIVKTIWPNEKNDNHKTLDINRVHLPEEFVPGKEPRRKLVRQEATSAPNYRPIPHTDENAKNKIIKNFGA